MKIYPLFYIMGFYVRYYLGKDLWAKNVYIRYVSAYFGHYNKK